MLKGPFLWDRYGSNKKRKMIAWLDAIFLFLVTKTIAQPRPSQVCLLVPPETDACYREFQGTTVTERAAQVNCLQKLLWNFQENNTMTDQDIINLMSLGDSGQEQIQTGPAGQSQRRPGYHYPKTGYRTRREYRTLSNEERQRFHRALNQLYKDGTIAMFARIHATAADKHQRGASFLPWNRAFLAYFEESLRRVDPSTSLPYWDSTLDDAIPNPVNSILWTSELFGNGVGDVTSGPAANWVTHQGRLQRNYGQFSRLMSKENLSNVLSRCRLKDISRPTARNRYSLERMLDGVDSWVGGDMGAPTTAAYDFIFYLHRAYADLVWEIFRSYQQRRCQTDPVTDYPTEATGSHTRNAPMVAFTWLKNEDGLANFWIQNWYGYEDSPSCPRCCPRCRYPRPIYCNRRRQVCVSRSRRIFPRRPLAGTSLMDIQIPATLEADVASDVMAETALVPRNRGRLYEGPPSDGRTRATALEDAFQSDTVADMQSDGIIAQQRNMLPLTRVGNFGAQDSSNAAMYQTRTQERRLL